jgi:hypothetical protein
MGWSNEKEHRRQERSATKNLPDVKDSGASSNGDKSSEIHKTIAKEMDF